MSDERGSRVRDAVELIDLYQWPVLGGWMRSAPDLDEHEAHGGKVNESGTMIVQTSKTADYRLVRALDLINSLPSKKSGAALVLARYCNPWMLGAYPGIIAALEQMGLYAREGNWTWSDALRRKAGGFVKNFWERAQKRRVVKK